MKFTVRNCSTEKRKQGNMTADKTHVLSASKEHHITNEITFVIA